MARSGRAGPALATAAIGSFVAGTVGTLGIAFTGPLIVDYALQLGPAEYFSLMVLCFVTVSAVLGGSDDNTINVQKTLVALDEPPIVDAVVACALSKRQNEGNDISLDLENLVKVRRLVKPAEALPGERAEEPLRFQV
jgi:hypothetical protein